ncbi:hypothetical protein GE21DRAFT_1101760, partial [Neurospora crassa]
MFFTSHKSAECLLLSIDSDIKTWQVVVFLPAQFLQIPRSCRRLVYYGFFFFFFFFFHR